MYRYLLEDLKKWKNKKNRKPLIIGGARQVGKTWLMKEFGNACFRNFAYINFDNNERMKNVFNQDFDINRILLAINAETHEKIIPNETLIIFDEIQEAPKAISSLKYFCENAKEYPVVAAGSLLGMAIHDGVSFPVGKVDLMTLSPLSFREFLLATKETELEEIISKKDYANYNIFSDKYYDLLKSYFFVGGMPEAVSAFIDERDYGEVRSIQKNLLSLYEADFGKHIDGRELERVRLVWNSIPMQLAKENKKFFFGKIKEGARAKEFELAIKWLLDCGLIGKVYNISTPKIPLKAYADFSSFKIYMTDIGLLSAASDLDSQTLLEGNRIFVEFKGALTEQYVYQQIISDTDYIPYYFSANSHTEIDFVVQKKMSPVPLEVKSAENLRAKSLKAFYEKYKPDEAVRASMALYKKEDWLTKLPLSMIHDL